LGSFGKLDWPAQNALGKEMSRRLIFRRQAERDLASIIAMIDDERPVVARRFLRATRAICDVLARSPELGQT
jgi:plasmid stabilization system protein ParE